MRPCADCSDVPNQIRFFTGANLMDFRPGPAVHRLALSGPTSLPYTRDQNSIDPPPALIARRCWRGSEGLVLPSTGAPKGFLPSTMRREGFAHGSPRSGNRQEQKNNTAIAVLRTFRWRVAKGRARGHSDGSCLPDLLARIVAAERQGYAKPRTRFQFRFYPDDYRLSRFVYVAASLVGFVCYAASILPVKNSMHIPFCTGLGRLIDLSGRGFECNGDIYHNWLASPSKQGIAAPFLRSS
jgi:hypothetical protein